MAKLSARGRTEVWRVERRVTTDSGGTRVTTLALMSDGHILRNLKSLTAAGKVAHNHGWGQYKKLKKVPKGELAAQQQRVKDKLLEHGFEEVKKR